MNRDLKLEQLVEYANMGWKIFPIYGIEDGKCLCENPVCKRQGKHLMTLYLKDATSDLNIISKWNNNYPNANWAVATGAVSGIIVIYINHNNVDEGLIWESPIPDTPFSITGGGRNHYFFIYPIFDFRFKIGRSIGGVDFKADQEYEILPPSMHISGQEYSWGYHPKDVDLASPPDFLVNLLSQIKNIGTSQMSKNYSYNGQNIKLTKYQSSCW